MMPRRPTRNHLREAIGIIFGSLAGGVVHHFLSAGFSNWLIPLVVVAIVFLVGIVIWMTQDALTLQEETRDLLQEGINAIRANLDILVTYISADDDTGPEKIFDESVRLISGAKKSILALNSFAEEQFDSSEGEERKAHREAYFDALLEASKRVAYTRLFQIDDDKHVTNLFDPTYIRHFRRMVEERDRRNQRRASSPPIELRRARPTYPSTFLIIDDQYLIWQQTEVDPNAQPLDPSVAKKVFRMRGVIVIEDPKHYVINAFCEAFKRANGRSDAVNALALQGPEPPAGQGGGVPDAAGLLPPRLPAT